MPNADLECFTDDVIPTRGVKEYNHNLQEYIQEHIAAVRSAYRLMKSQRLEISTTVLADSTNEILQTLHQNRDNGKEGPLVDRNYRYIDEYNGPFIGYISCLFLLGNRPHSYYIHSLAPFD